MKRILLTLSLTFTAWSLCYGEAICCPADPTLQAVQTQTVYAPQAVQLQAVAVQPSYGYAQQQVLLQQPLFLGSGHRFFNPRLFAPRLNAPRLPRPPRH